MKMTKKLLSVVLAIAMSASLMAVSYTHLDVYKRQDLHAAQAQRI